MFSELRDAGPDLQAPRLAADVRRRLVRLDVANLPEDFLDEDIDPVDEVAYDDSAVGLQILKDHSRSGLEANCHVRLARRRPPRRGQDDGLIVRKPDEVTEFRARLHSTSRSSRLPSSNRGSAPVADRHDRHLEGDMMRGQGGFAVLSRSFRCLSAGSTHLLRALLYGWNGESALRYLTGTPGSCRIRTLLRGSKKSIRVLSQTGNWNCDLGSSNTVGRVPARTSAPAT